MEDYLLPPTDMGKVSERKFAGRYSGLLITFAVFFLLIVGFFVLLGGAGSFAENKMMEGSVRHSLEYRGYKYGSGYLIREMTFKEAHSMYRDLTGGKDFRSDGGYTSMFLYALKGLTTPSGKYIPVAYAIIECDMDYSATIHKVYTPRIKEDHYEYGK